jgi:rubrerythrin
MNVFDMVEMVNIGIEKEKKRRDFYDKVSNLFDDKNVTDLFRRLRDWEEEHISKFETIKDAIRESSSSNSYPEELTGYTQALLDDTLYEKLSLGEFAKRIETPLSAIRYAIEFEKDAILFFSEFIPYLRNDDRAVIETLIDEEKKHIVFLSNLSKELKS